MLKLIYGIPRSGKKEYIYTDIEEKIQNGEENIILITPQQYSFQAEKDIIGLQKKLVNYNISKVRALHFNRFAHEASNLIGENYGPCITNAGKCILIYQVLQELKDKLVIFRKAAEKKGFISILSGTITEIKRYGITSEQLQNDEINEEPLKQKSLEIAMIFEAYNEKLGDLKIDSDEYLNKFSQLLSRNDELFQNTHIYIHGFQSFTPQQRNIVYGLFSTVKTITITLNTDILVDPQSKVDIDIFHQVKKEAQLLLDVARNSGIKTEIVKAEEVTKLNNEIRFVRDSYPFVSYSLYSEKPKSVQIFQAKNTYSEIENTARKIVGLVRDTDIKYRDIAVVMEGVESKESMIRAIFNRHDIPAFIDKKEDILEHPIINTILAVFEVLSKNWSHQDIFRILKANLTNIQSDEVALLENYALAYGIDGRKRWTQEVYLDLYPEMKDKREDIERVRKKLVTPLLNLEVKLQGRVNAEDACTALYEYFMAIRLYEKIEKKANELDLEANIEESSRYRQIWNILIKLLDNIVVSSKDMNLNIKELSEIFLIALSQYNIGIIPPAIEQVTIGSVSRTKIGDVKALFILGVNDGIIPKVIKAEGVLSDRERQKLRDSGVVIADDTKTQGFNRQLDVYNMLCSPSQYLHISYAIADIEGKTMYPSPIIKRFKKLFPNLVEVSDVIESDDLDSQIKKITNSEAVFGILIEQIRNKADKISIHPIWDYVFDWYTENKGDKIKTLREGLNYNVNTGIIPRMQIEERYGNTLYTSISRIEKYLSCPFAYHMQYGIHADIRREYAIKSSDIGSCLHSMMEKIAKEIENNIGWDNITEEETEEAVDRQIEVYIEENKNNIFTNEAEGRNVLKKLSRLTKTVVKSTVKHIQGGKFTPYAYEIAFGGNRDLSSLQIELEENKKLRINGIIDRLDTYETEEGTWVRIVDYKSGRKDITTSDIANGMQLQLMAYLQVIVNSKELNINEPILPAGILYSYMGNPVVEGDRNETVETIETKKRKELKLKGILVKNPDVIKAMDSSISNGGTSMIIPANIKKDGTLGVRTKAFEKEALELLGKYTEMTLKKAAEDILKGEINIKPVKDTMQIACDYCSYGGVCGFDPMLPGCDYKNVQKMNKAEAMEYMKEKLSSE